MVSDIPGWYLAGGRSVNAAINTGGPPGLPVIFLGVPDLRTVGLIAFACLIPLAGSGQTTHKKRPATSASKPSSGQKTRAKSGTKLSKSGTTRSRSRAAGNTTTAKYRRGSRGKTASWRTRQLAPNPARYKEIQQALAARGYLKAAPSGVWDNESADALRHFQQDQNLEPTGKLNSMSLIALGLGPKHEGGPVPATPKAVQPPQNPTAPAVPQGSIPQGAAEHAPPAVNTPSSTPSSSPPKTQP